jgi:hypothetical protein
MMSEQFMGGFEQHGSRGGARYPLRGAVLFLAVEYRRTIDDKPETITIAYKPVRKYKQLKPRNDGVGRLVRLPQFIGYQDDLNAAIANLDCSDQRKNGIRSDLALEQLGN